MVIVVNTIIERNIINTNKHVQILPRSMNIFVFRKKERLKKCQITRFGFGKMGRDYVS